MCVSDDRLGFHREQKNRTRTREGEFSLYELDIELEVVFEEV